MTMSRCCDGCDRRLGWFEKVFEVAVQNYYCVNCVELVTPVDAQAEQLTLAL